MKTPKVIAVAVLIAALGFAIDQPATAAIGPQTWADEFNGAAGSAINSANWAFDVGGGGWGNNQLEYDTNSTRNIALDGAGNLVITARRENPSNLGCWYGTCTYTSGRIKTQGKFSQAFGRFEARIKIPRGQGLWPAFWMLGNDIGSVGWPTSGEIDIMENIGREPNQVHGTIHGPGYSGGEGIGAGFSIGGAFADAFHTFAVDWAPDSITWYVDGTQYQRRTAADLGGDRWVFDHPFFILLNVAVGGFWPGNPDGSTVFPQTMTVDYVRVFSWTTGGGGGGRTGRITGLGGKCVDVAGASTTNGTQVQLWTCNGTAAQTWTIGTDGTIRALGKCLDVNGANPADGTKVQLWDCNGTAAQRWTAGANGSLQALGKCLDARGNSSADGTPLQIWSCTGGANQRWTLPA